MSFLDIIDIIDIRYCYTMLLSIIEFSYSLIMQLILFTRYVVGGSYYSDFTIFGSWPNLALLLLVSRFPSEPRENLRALFTTSADRWNVNFFFVRLEFSNTFKSSMAGSNSKAVVFARRRTKFTASRTNSISQVCRPKSRYLFCALFSAPFRPNMNFVLAYFIVHETSFGGRVVGSMLRNVAGFIARNLLLTKWSCSMNFKPPNWIKSAIRLGCTL